MNFKVSHVFAFLIQVLLTVKLVASDPSDVLVRIFYETQSTDCMNFFVNQLIPVYKQLGDHFLTRFIPYGKATKTYCPGDGLWSFRCHHGYNECRCNMLHACALNQIKNRDIRFGFIGCLMTTKDEFSVLDKCSDMFNVDTNKLIDCINCKKGNELLSGYGNETSYFFRDGLNDVPTITVNGVFKQDEQVLAFFHFKNFVCKYINFYSKSPPKICRQH